MRIGALALAAAFLFLTLGCQNNRSERVRESEIDRAGALIDQERYDEAITLLEDMRKDSGQLKIKVYLASAYAGRAGLKSVEYWQVSKRYKQILEEEKNEDPKAAAILSPKSLPGAVPRWIRFAIPHFDKKLREFNRVRSRLSALPLIPEEKRADIEKARDVLSESANEGPRLYRAVLGIILMRSHFEEANERVAELNTDKEGNCSPVVGSILHQLKISYVLTVEILSDLRLAFPSKAAEIDAELAKNQLTPAQREQLESLARPEGRSVCKEFPVLKGLGR
ncbi:MAG: hypothetical protein KF767_06715 [Bdellovibrionaceae bacterium]|nr:hypothetical protein [Pseudobdellovibrionaceae bacterium]